MDVFHLKLTELSKDRKITYICSFQHKKTIIKASFYKYLLNFKIPGGTSRGVLHQKETYFLVLKAENKIGIGECGIFRGLSFDDKPDYEQRLRWVCDHIGKDKDELLESVKAYPSMVFGLEQALLSLESMNPFELFPSEFSQGRDSILINGLIWMGEESYMKEQIRKKLQEGFSTLKMKIGAIDFKTEINILNSVRQEFSASDLELRVDANGAFSPQEAPGKLDALAALDIHSIEQPIRAGQIGAMANLCHQSPVPIALDEELIGILEPDKKEELLAKVKPKYIILKPSLIGGFKGSKEWISLCEQYGISWWITSALESNIGLNAIAQFTYTLKNRMPQGLGTGGLFTNNFEAPLYVDQGALRTDPGKKWGNIMHFLEKAH